MSLPSTSLIIASRDRPELLADTVASVLKGDEVPAEIVIVDQSRVPHPTLSKPDGESRLRDLLSERAVDWFKPGTQYGHRCCPA